MVLLGCPGICPASCGARTPPGFPASKTQGNEATRESFLLPHQTAVGSGLAIHGFLACTPLPEQASHQALRYSGTQAFEPTTWQTRSGSMFSVPPATRQTSI